MSDVIAVTLGDTVRVMNLDSTQLSIPWDGRPHVIAPESEGFVPFDCAKLYFGDPRSSDKQQKIKDPISGNVQFIPERTTEVKRLQQLWQNSVVQFREYIPGDMSWLKDGISDRCPNVEVYALTGDRIYTVIDDPVGDHIVEANSPTIADRNTDQRIAREQAETISRQQKMIDALIKHTGIDPAEFNVDAAKADPIPEAPEAGVIEEEPVMQFNARTKRITPKRTQESDPTTLDGLPEDS